MKGRVYTIVYMIIVTAAATALLTGARLALSRQIDRNRQLREHRAVLYALKLIPLDEKPTSEEVERLYTTRVKEAERDGATWYEAYGPDGEALQAVGRRFRGDLYWGPGVGVMSADPARERVVGLYFIEHAETPGLGGRITETWFLEQFEDKPIDPPIDDDTYFEFIPEERDPGPRQVNAISGATRTSEAVADLLNSAAGELREEGTD